MQIFVAVQKYFALMGFESKQLTKKQPFNLKNTTTLFILALITILVSIFLFCEADTFRKLADSFYVTCTVTSGFVIFAINISKMPDLFKLVENMERIILKSELG